VHVVPGDDLEKLGLENWVRDLGSDDLVIIIRPSQLIIRMKDKENVGMGETSLLVLNDVDLADDFAEDLLLQQLLHQGLKLQLEDSSNDIGTVIRFLSCDELLGDLRPVGAACEGNKKVWLAQLPNNRHGILVVLLHIPRATGEAGGKDIALANLSSISITLKSHGR
jgi:hypothetical protein